MRINKLFLKFFSLTLAAVLLTNCDNEVDVIGEWKEIPVVYAVFGPNPDLGTNYFRIEKAFLDPKTDALVVAKRPDSIYYGVNDLDVILFEKYREDTSYRAIDTLEIVDANTLGITRDSGIFVNNPNYVYRSDAQIIGSDRDRFYKLEIRNKTNGRTFTQVCNGITMGRYVPTDNAFTCFNITSPTYTNTVSRPISLCARNPISNNFEFQDVRFTWTQPKNAAIFDLTAIFRYYEFQEINGVIDSTTWTEKSISWKVFRNYISSGDCSPSENIKISGENFYAFLSNNLTDVSGTNTRRCAHRFDLRMDCGGNELAELINSRNANSNLIGGLFPSDLYTNIEDGIGIFTYKFHIQKNNYRISAESVEYLNENESTRKLGFKSTICN
jgi:hypothetical protein